MRNLTIRRGKSFVGCLAKLKIYVEDPASEELTISGTPCKKIGELKNGEEKTFSVDEQARRVFVIADKLSKDYCNESYQLPEGTEDVFLSGKNHFNPGTGNAFRFDNNDSEAVLADRKQNAKKGWIVLIAAVLLGALFGFLLTSGFISGQRSREKAFSSNGMTITLTAGFQEIQIANYTVTYDSRNVAVFAMKEPFSLAEGFENNSLDQYADLLIQANGWSDVKKFTHDGLSGFEYDFTNPTTKLECHYTSYVYRSDDAFWVVQFATLKENADKFAEQIKKWARSVSFSGEAS